MPKIGSPNQILNRASNVLLDPGFSVYKSGASHNLLHNSQQLMLFLLNSECWP